MQTSDQTAKLLVVDDDRLVLATLSHGLRAAGFEVHEAASGEDAISIAKNQRPALAILDMRMPGMDGIEVAHWMRTHTDIPFIFLSAYPNEDIVTPAVREGALSYLVKPLDVSQLIPAVHVALARSAEIRQLRENETHLNRALTGDRATSTAVGIMMQRHHLSESDAFARLRRYARSQRRKLSDIALQVVANVEDLNKIAGPDCEAGN